MSSLCEKGAHRACGSCMQLMSLYNQSVQLASACGVRSQFRLVSRTLSSVCGARTQRRSGSRALFESFESIPSTKRQSMLVRSHRSRGSSQVKCRVTSSLSQCLQFGQALSKKERITLLAQCAHLAHVTRYRDALADSSRISCISRVSRNSCVSHFRWSSRCCGSNLRNCMRCGISQFAEAAKLSQFASVWQRT